MIARLVVPVAILANAIAQAVLVMGDPTPEWSFWFVIGSSVSAGLWLATYALIAARSVAPHDMAGLLSGNAVRFVLWTIAWLVVVGFALIPLGGVLGLALLVVTPYVPIAAMSGESNALLANLRSIRRRPLAYAWRVVVFALLVIAFALASALNAFFVTGALSAFINCLVAAAILWLATWSFARAIRARENRAES